MVENKHWLLDDKLIGLTNCPHNGQVLADNFHDTERSVLVALISKEKLLLGLAVICQHLLWPAAIAWRQLFLNAGIAGRDLL